MVGKVYMLYVLGSFLFPTKKGTDVSVKYLSFFQDNDVNKPWSWGATKLAHLYYSLGASSRVNAKGLSCCTTLLEVVWDSYLEKRDDKHNFKEVASFTGLLCSTEHNEPYYPDRVQRQFNRRQPVPQAPTCVEQSGLHLYDKPCAYKSKYNWVDLFSDGKWRDSIILTRGRKIHDGIPVCTEGYFEWFNSVSFTKLYPDAVNLAEDDDYDDARVLRDRGGVSQRENVEVPHSQNEGGGGPGKTSECAFLMEANLRMQADIQEKDAANSICEKKLNEKYESNKKLVEDLRMQLANKVKENEMLSSINDKLMKEVCLNQEARPLPVRMKYDKKLNSKLGSTLRGKRRRSQNVETEFQLDIRYVERDGNTTFRVAATYAYQSQMKFLNVKDSLCTLMTKKSSYWKNIFSQRLDVAYNDLRERMHETLLRAFKFNAVFVEYLYMGYLLATYYEKVVIFISNKEALTFLPLFWRKANNKITKEKRFENILADSTKYWWVGMTSDENFVKLKSKYQSPILPVSTL
ncbi:hypothetical protein GIB67_027489 [Kingdonia uniflora]|uniref:Aminotransferase-like plant mobile domain-containing protein n=1 Tax=Kingdonia uniflora TaxID=39325 RepID=A0A7J7MFM8_9MAGN|nr:hypothetical protein GIB67_027489 [Kingdonia uniflora]